MDGESHSSLWSKLGSLFSGKSSEDHLEQAIREAREDGELKAEESSMLLSILSLDELQVQDIMTPRIDIEALPSGTPILEAAGAIVETGYTRLPIFKETRDNIIGVVHAKDLLGSLTHPEERNAPVDSIMSQPFFVPETKIASELLQEFRTRKNHLAIVVDEYGGTSGLATIEDLLFLSENKQKADVVSMLGLIKRSLKDINDHYFTANYTEALKDFCRMMDIELVM